MGGRTQAAAKGTRPPPENVKARFVSNTTFFCTQKERKSSPIDTLHGLNIRQCVEAVARHRTRALLKPPSWI